MEKMCRNIEVDISNMRQTRLENIMVHTRWNRYRLHENLSPTFNISGILELQVHASWEKQWAANRQISSKLIENEMEDISFHELLQPHIFKIISRIVLDHKFVPADADGKQISLSIVAHACKIGKDLIKKFRNCCGAMNST